MTEQNEFFSELGDVSAIKVLLADLQDNLHDKISRFRYITDIGMRLGSAGTMIPGGEIAYGAWVEARSSFVHGNFISTIILCQSMCEIILASHLHISLVTEIKNKIQFRETVQLCLRHNIIDKDDAHEIDRLMAIRNPLTHYRDVNDPSSPHGRFRTSGIPFSENLQNDAWFAIGFATKILSKKEFRVDSEEHLV